jgi:hypothetical protein
MMPSIFPATQEEIVKKLEFIKDMFEKIGVPLFSDEYWEQVNNAMK